MRVLTVMYRGGGDEGGRRRRRKKIDRQKMWLGGLISIQEIKSVSKARACTLLGIFFLHCRQLIVQWVSFIVYYTF